MNKINFSCMECGTALDISSDQAGKKVKCPACHKFTMVPLWSTVDKPQSDIPQSDTPQTFSAPESHGFKAFKYFMIILLFCFLIMGAFAAFPVILGAAAILFFVFIVPQYLFTTVGTDMIHGSDPNYQNYREKGGHPFWDNLSGPTTVWTLPYTEPTYTGFVPPTSWKYQCLNCYARIESPAGNCWHCNDSLVG